MWWFEPESKYGLDAEQFVVPPGPLTVRVYAEYCPPLNTCEPLVFTLPTFERYALVAFEDHHETVTNPSYGLFPLER